MIGKLLIIQHSINPLHLYCRLVNAGLAKGLSSGVCRSYEALLFSWVNRGIKCVFWAYGQINRLACSRNDRVLSLLERFQVGRGSKVSGNLGTIGHGRHK